MIPNILTHYTSERANSMRSQLVALTYCEGDSGEPEQARMGLKYPSTLGVFGFGAVLRARSNPPHCQRGEAVN